MMTEQITQATTFATPPFYPANQASNATPYRSGALDMSVVRRAIGVASAGVIASGGDITLVFQACLTSGGTFTNVTSGATVTLNTSNTMGTIEMRADQLPANTRYVKLACYVNGNAAFGAAFLLGQDCAYKPGSQYNFNTDNTTLQQDVM